MRVGVLLKCVQHAAQGVLELVAYLGGVMFEE